MQTDIPEIPDWPRPQYQPGGGDALVFYMLFGEFHTAMDLTPEYRSRGLPEGVVISLHGPEYVREVLESVAAIELGQQLREGNPELFAAVAESPHVLIVQGTVADPPTLDYLRDVVGILMALLDTEAVAVLDWQSLAWFSPERWRERMFAPNAPVPAHHVSVILSEEAGEDTVFWMHTRGLRKFGRPDLSIRRVPEAYLSASADFCQLLIDLQAFGGIIPEGQAVAVPDLSPAMVCHHGGDYEDPDFNNVHIEMVFPTGEA